MNAIGAIGMIAAGSFCAASFYVPLQKVQKWSWEVYWLAQGIAAWLLAPWLFVWLTVPDGTLFSILSGAPSTAKWLSIFFGALWGIGGLTFGLSIRYLGIALGQSIALGFCAAFGTLIPPIVAGENLLATPEGVLMVIGVAVCVAGLSIIGYAGMLKNKNLTDAQRKEAVKEFALKKGLLIALLAGLMSAAFSFGFEAGKPIDAVALAHGTNPLFQSNPTLVFILLGGFFTNLVYCIFLMLKNKSYRDFGAVTGGLLLRNLSFSFLGGVLWFLQFHFYGMGKSQLPAGIAAFSWSILMALNIALGNVWGIWLKEWKGAGTKTMTVLWLGIVVLIFSTFVVNF